MTITRKRAAAVAFDRRADSVRSVTLLFVLLVLGIAKARADDVPFVSVIQSIASTIMAVKSVCVANAMNWRPDESCRVASVGCSYPLLSNSRTPMGHDDLPPFVRELLYADEHHLFKDKFGRALRRYAALGLAEGDQFVREEIRGRVRRHMIAQAFAGPFAMPRLKRGELVWGQDLRGAWLRAPLKSLDGHCCTLSGSGGGKTTRLYFMSLQIAPCVRGAWWFEMRKNEFGKLRPYLQRLSVELTVLNARQLRLNPLQVPAGVAPADWAPRIADMLVLVLELPQRASKLLHSRIVGLYRQFNIFDGARRFPTLFDLYHAIKKDEQANVPARQAVLDSLEPVLLSLGPGVLAYRYGWTTDELAKREVVFEFGGIDEISKNLLLNTLLLSEFTSRLARGVSNPRMDLWVCVDEAQRLVAASNLATGMSDLIGLIRGSGITLELSLQSSSDIAAPVLSSTANKVIGRCGSATDYDAIGAAMGLNTDQRRYLALNLQPGLFAAQLGAGCRKPFLFRIPPMLLRNTNAGGAGDIGTLKRLPTEPA